MLRSALGLGLAAGCLEVALRASPRLGLSLGESLAWLGVGAALSAVLAAVAALPGARFARLPGPGLALGALLGLHAALAWRFELFVNAFASDPRLLAGLAAIALASAAAAWFLDRPLRRAGGRLDLACAVLALGAAATAIVRGLPAAEAGEGAGPNVLVVTLDTVRADALEPWGGSAPTPAIARLAREGALFEQAIAAAPLTEASHLAMLTGLAPTTTGVVANGTDFGDQPALIFHAFDTAGYATGGFVAGFPLSGRWGWTQGMDVYDDDFGAMPGLHRLSLVKAWDQVMLPAHTLRERRADAVVDRALRWLARVHDRPWFLWVHLFDPHGPYEPPDPWRPAAAPSRDGQALDLPPYWPPALRTVTDTGWLTDAYLGEVRWTDHQVGALLDGLRALGALDGTLIAVVADHGESLTEHGYLFDHGDDLFDPSLRVPWLVWMPGVVPAGLRLPCQASTVDLASTLLEAAGLDPASPPRDGRSRWPELVGVEPCAESDAFATTVAGRLVEDPPLDHALRGRGLKLVAHEDGTSELYDLAADPGEVRDLAADRSAETAALRAVLDAHVEGSRITAPNLDPSTRAALEALGYIE